MKFLTLQFVIFGLATAASADDLQNFLITTNQAAEIKQKLEAFEKGDINLDETAPSMGGCQKLIDYYSLHTNDVSIKMKLPICRCFAALDKYPEAERLATEYLDVYSNDWRGWKILGVAYLKMANYSAAVEALTNSARLGDGNSYTPLAFAA
ncbi:MAG TPA: hypothetical protein VK810_03165, partial [Dongiaceae bacterium]|nr:hypothetical protein [Dongiaceae bacterium]